VYFEIELLFLLKTNDYYFFRYILTMKTLTLHTNCSLAAQRNEWQGIGMFSTIANPAVLNLGKVDYIGKKLRDTDVG
jgi:hypothetical protein